MSRPVKSEARSRSTAGAYLALTKPRIIGLLLVTTVPTRVVAAGGLPSGSLGLAPLVLFAGIFVWTPPHFWALAVKYRDDYAAADVPMLPAVASAARVGRQIVIYSVALWGASLLLTPVAGMGVIYTVSAVV